MGIVSYIMSVLIACIIMIIALTIRVYKSKPSEVVSFNEASFAVFITIGCLIPGFNLIASIYYLCVVVRR